MAAFHAPMHAMVENASGRTPLLLTCEHATNWMPAGLHGLGLPQSLLQDHVAWDIGAFETAKVLARRLDAPLIGAPASRLLVDPNRDLSAKDLIPMTAEGAPIFGNLYLSREEREARIEAYHAPYHAEIERFLHARSDIIALASIHSFTPQLFGQKRPWHVGVLFDHDERLSAPMIETLTRDKDLVVGLNEPYPAANGLFYSMDRHRGARAVVEIEIRNDLIRDAAGQAHWAEVLTAPFQAALSAVLR
jgi:predicted N-formylglutamate amidohydrolase